MKKVLWLFGLVVLLLISANPAFASVHTEDELAEGVSIIEAANVEIESKIQEAVAEADRLSAEYVAALELQSEGHSVEKQAAVNAFLAEVFGSTELTDDEFFAASRQLQASLTGKFQIMKETQAYMKELNAVIQECFDETLAISQDAIARAAEKGVVGECVWVPVQFGYKTQLIDPIKIVGEY